MLFVAPIPVLQRVASLMSAWLSLLLCGAASWLIGSIPFSLLIARFGGGIDLRQHGSGNVGATNVARTMGARWGALALLLDAAKGAAPVLLLPWLLSPPDVSPEHQRVLCGICAVLGHMFPPWLGFRGGKGVATALGVVAVLAPLAMGIAFAAFATTFALVRIVSLSSIVAAVTFAAFQLCFHGSQLWTAQTWGLGVFSIAVPLMIVIRHRSNLVRLWKGTEPRMKFGKEHAQG